VYIVYMKVTLRVLAVCVSSSLFRLVPDLTSGRRCALRF
jgi:hypothetical protein